jgi:hypothetical protein
VRGRSDGPDAVLRIGREKIAQLGRQSMSRAQHVDANAALLGIQTDMFGMPIDPAIEAVKMTELHAAETGNAAPPRANVAENRGLSLRPQETGLVQDCVVEIARLGLRAYRLWLSNRSPSEVLWPVFPRIPKIRDGKGKTPRWAANVRFRDRNDPFRQARGGSTESRSSDSVTRYPRAE